MTVYKAFRNFYIFLISAAIVLGAVGGGFLAYELCYPNSGESVYALSKYGSTGSEVKTLQQKLKDLGFYNGDVDGIFGTQTQTAVRNFQRSVGITVDGIAGPTTLLYLGLDTGTSSPSTQYSSSDVQLLAKVISAEARGESYEGQVAVVGSGRRRNILL